MRRTTQLSLWVPKVLLVPLVLLGAGCQQMAWKPGASAADLDRDTAACEAQYADETAVQDCLRKRGWVVRVPKSSGDEVEAEVAGVAAAGLAETAAPQAGAVASQPVAPSTPGSRPAAAGATPGEPQSITAPVPRNKPVPKPVDPLKPILIQAWWKMGAQADGLNADIGACVDKLGPAHKPDLQKRLYTRGLIDCMKGMGWFGK